MPEALSAVEGDSVPVQLTHALMWPIIPPEPKLETATKPGAGWPPLSVPGLDAVSQLPQNRLVSPEDTADEQAHVEELPEALAKDSMY